ncbi:MAG: hypothetical protein ACRC9V_13200 [Aeromonas sp.]
MLATSASELQVKLDGLVTTLAGCGMTLNAKKSSAITIEKDGRTKAMLLAPEYYRTGNGQINPLGIGDTQRYLGLDYGWKGRVTPKRTAELERMLEEVKNAPLKPQQRLSILGDFLVPRLIHGLVLGNAHRNTLRKLDIMIRRAVRLWLRLPRDTSLGLFYTPTSKGGLNIISLEVHIPLAQKTRFSKLLSGRENIIQAITGSISFKTMLRRTEAPVKAAGSVVTSTNEARTVWTKRLVSSVDGRELAEVDVDEGSHQWIKIPDRVFPRLFIRGLQLRGGTLSTKSRPSRGRASSIEDRNCRGECQAIETLNHILQKCARTHDVRCARHNRVMRLVCKKLRRTDHDISVEPVVPCLGTYIKPDIVVHRTERLTVLDITVVSGYRLRESWDLKAQKYGGVDCMEAMRAWWGVGLKIDHLPVIVSSRGVMYGPTGRGLRRLGFTTRDVMDICLSAIQGSLNTYDMYMRGN